MVSGPPSSGDAETVQVLRQIKEAETEWEAKLREARGEAEQTVRRAHDEADATVKAVLAEVEGERVRRLEAAQAACDAEVEVIRREGASAAESIRASKERRPADRRDEIVAVVLGLFSGD